MHYLKRLYIFFPVLSLIIFFFSTTEVKAKSFEINNIEIYGNASERIGVISFNIRNVHPHDLAQFLNEYNIALRVGHHCAQPLLSKLNKTSTARLSTYIYNDEKDIDKLCSALQEILGYFK